jgi:hypothetical protein
MGAEPHDRRPHHKIFFAGTAARDRLSWSRGARRDRWTQHVSGVLGTTRAWSWFGQALTAADFNGDGYADLIVRPFGHRCAGPDLGSGHPDVAGSADFLDQFGAALS